MSSRRSDLADGAGGRGMMALCRTTGGMPVSARGRSFRQSFLVACAHRIGVRQQRPDQRAVAEHPAAGPHRGRSRRARGDAW